MVQSFESLVRTGFAVQQKKDLREGRWFGKGGVGAKGVNNLFARGEKGQDGFEEKVIRKGNQREPEVENTIGEGEKYPGWEFLKKRSFRQGSDVERREKKKLGKNMRPERGITQETQGKCRALYLR